MARLIGARPMAQDERDMKSTSQLAQEFILDLSRGDFPRAFGSFDSDMQAAVPLVALRNTWRAALTKLGRLLRHDRMEELERAGYRVCVVHCEFERGTYALRLWFNGERIAGMAMEDPLAGPAGTP